MSKKKDKIFVRCYESHPELKFVGKDGKTYSLMGGSCVSPFDGYDIYVGLDLGMSVSEQGYPWVKGHEFLFPITDHSVPKDVDQFKKMVTWLIGMLKAKKKIHIGCIGGHGRTGLVFSAIYRQLTGKTNAIQYVRKNYCKKAVESKTQVKFLMKHYGVDKAEGSSVTSYIGRSYSYNDSSAYSSWKNDNTYDYNKYFDEDVPKVSGRTKNKYFPFEDYDNITITPKKHKMSIIK